MKTFISFLEEAKEENDAAFRKEARDVLNKITQALSSVSLFRLKDAIVQNTGQQNYIAFNLKYLINYPTHFIFALASDKNISAGGYTDQSNLSVDGKHPLISINHPNIDIAFDLVESAIMNNETEKEDELHGLLESIMKHKVTRKTFIHEFTHHLDFIRMKKSGAEVHSGKFISNDSDPSAYYNQPIELNAYYQENLFSFEEEEIKKIFLQWDMGQKDQAKEIVKQLFGKVNAQNVLNYFIEFMKDTTYFWENLTDQNKRRIKKRFLNYYKSIEKRLLEIEKYNKHIINEEFNVEDIFQEVQRKLTRGNYNWKISGAAVLTSSLYIEVLWTSKDGMEAGRGLIRIADHANHRPIDDYYDFFFNIAPGEYTVNEALRELKTIIRKLENS